MNLENFFANNWGNLLQFLDFDSEFKNKNTSLDIAEIAIILSANKDNYERYFLLKEFRDIFNKIDLRVDIFGVQIAQICSINFLKKGYIFKHDLLKALKILEPISKNFSIYEFIEKLDINNIDKKDLFENAFNNLNDINLELQELCLNQNTKSRLQKTLEKFKKLEFSVAITGIMNSGKSSLLNALLKQDFLGVSNIPETANLTVLKYGISPKATIYFWNKLEWENVLTNSKYNEELREFIDKLSSEINLDDYILDDNLTKEITLAQLKEFSSAKNKISALIKKIEIISDLKFLQNNICIVDTPGLDDVVVQRELITSEYLKESDFLIHLMNASQSLTQKDFEFLLHCLLDSRLSKFLVVLTKSDLLDEKDLNEVIKYTKDSLKIRLKEIDENLIEKIDFLCVSAKKASEFYRANASKESLEESGMLEFEKYLFDELFSSQKSKIALNAYKKELVLELKNILEQRKIQNKIIKDKSNNLSEENSKFLYEFKKQNELLKELKKDLQEACESLENTESGVENLVLLLAKKLKERLIDEIKYLNNNKQKIKSERILNIIDITIKDGINDILRDIKYQNIKKIEDLKENLSTKYEFLKDGFNNGFDTLKEDISKSIDGIFKDDKLAFLRLGIVGLLEEKQGIFDMELKLDKLVNSSFKDFQIDKILKNLNINKTFFDFINLKLNDFEISQKEKIQELENSLNIFQDKNADFVKSYEKNLEIIARLEHLKMELHSED